MAKEKASYQQLKDELDNIMAALQRDDLDVDDAMEKYRRGLELVVQMEEYLKTAENKIKDLKAKFKPE